MLKENKIAFFILLAFMAGCKREEVKTAPNILICIADDAGHMGKDFPWVKTPAFDSVARAGIRFSNAYTPNAKCAPSRACLLTARNSWQLKEAANHYNNFPTEFKTYPEAFEAFGYFTGFTGKGWGPGNPGEVNGKMRELCGKEWNAIKTSPPTKSMSNRDYSANFIDFYNHKPDDQPFCFWYGGHEPHRMYEYGSSLKAGKKLSDIEEVPVFFPDNEIVRTDLLDYALEIEYFDAHVGKILDFLKSKGELENTLVIVTSDHGMPFPRVKSDEYDHSNHIPLAMMWGKNIKDPGRVVNEYVSLIDIAPTFFEAAGLEWEESNMQETPGKSLLSFLKGDTEDFSDYVLIGKERHDVGRPNDYGYPIRGIVKDGWMYLRNYKPDLWPAGNPECGYPTVDGSPTKTEVLKLRHNPETKVYWDWSFGKRPAEELFYLPDDPYCIYNLSSEDKHKSTKDELINIMEEELTKQSDPRMFGKGDVFHTYEYTDKRWRNLYERMVENKENVVPVWINETDIELDIGEPLRVIFETDMGNDIDDALALDMLYKYTDQGRVNLLAVSTNKNNKYSVEYLDILNTWYGYPHIPLGKVVRGADSEGNAQNYTQTVCEYQANGDPAFKRSIDDYATVPESTDRYREVLAQQPDSSVTIISVGFSTNIARLLDTPPDELSPLNGKELLAKKVKLLSMMAGNFKAENAKEYNVIKDISAARKVFDEWPTPIVVSPFEVGETILYPASSIESDFNWANHHPVVIAYKSYLEMPYNRPTWDLTSVLYAVEGKNGYFDISSRGRISVDDSGSTHFQEDPSGQHTYLKLKPEQIPRVRDRFIEIISAKPRSAD